jgi:hypothetical protein
MTAGVRAVGAANSDALDTVGITELGGFTLVYSPGVPCCTNLMDVGGNLSFWQFIRRRRQKFCRTAPNRPFKGDRLYGARGTGVGNVFRGTGRIQNGSSVIVVPESFRLVSSSQGLMVQLTPVGGFANLSVAKERLEEILVQGSSDVTFHFLVQGVRAGFEDHQTIRENEHFSAHGTHDLKLQTKTPQIVRRLRSNGTLNKDGSTNLQTAHQLGWDTRSDWNTRTAGTAPPSNSD